MSAVATPTRRNRLTSRLSPQIASSPLSESLNLSVLSPSASPSAQSDAFIFEIGSRYLRAGLPGEPFPRGIIGFDPSTQGIAGDYADYLPGTLQRTYYHSYDTWGNLHTLWTPDIRDVNLGLLADKIERAVRTAISEHILILDDGKRRAFTVAVDSHLAHPLLATLLTTLFNLYPPLQTVTLYPNSLLCTVAAGLRSALVVDIGWEETSVTAVYEYRQVLQRRTVRGAKLLTWNVSRLVHSALAESGLVTQVSFEEIEDITARLAHCRSPAADSSTAEDTTPITIPLTSTTPPTSLTVPLSRFSNTVAATFFSTSTSVPTPTPPASPVSNPTPDPSTTHPDDHDLPLPSLLYATLLALPIDVRATLLPRILITGGPAAIPGLPDRLVADLTLLIAARGWDPVRNYGSAATRPRPRPPHTALPVVTATSPQDTTATPALTAPGSPPPPPAQPEAPDTPPPTHLRPHTPDPILAAVRAPTSASALPSRPAPTSTPSSTSTPHPRAIRTLGAFAGASLLTGMEGTGAGAGEGAVVVGRERWRREGAAGGVLDSAGVWGVW